MMNVLETSYVIIDDGCISSEIKFDSLEKAMKAYAEYGKDSNGLLFGIQLFRQELIQDSHDNKVYKSRTLIKFKNPRFMGPKSLKLPALDVQDLMHKLTRYYSFKNIQEFKFTMENLPMEKREYTLRDIKMIFMGSIGAMQIDPKLTLKVLDIHMLYDRDDETRCTWGKILGDDYTYIKVV